MVQHCCAPNGNRCKYKLEEDEFNTLEDDDGRTPIESYLRDHFKKKHSCGRQEPDMTKLVPVVFKNSIFDTMEGYQVKDPGGNISTDIVAIQHHPGGHPSDKRSHYHVRTAFRLPNNSIRIIDNGRKSIPVFKAGTSEESRPYEHYWLRSDESALQMDNNRNNDDIDDQYCNEAGEGESECDFISWAAVCSEGGSKTP